MKTKTKNKNINRISFIVALFFVLAQISQANVTLGISISAEEVINLTNESRIEAGLPILLVNEKLSEAAKEKADDMFEFQYFDHNSPSGLTPWDFIKSAGYEYKYAGENLAIDFVTANGAHKALMESSSHRENILNSNYTEIGIATVEGMFDGNKSIIIVEEFGMISEKNVVEDYNPNENIELILEEEVNEINNLKDNTEEDNKKNELDSFSENYYVSQNDSTQDSRNDVEQKYEVKGTVEEGIDEQNNDLLYNNFNFPPSILYKNKEKDILLTCVDGSDLNKEKNSSVVIKYDPILLTKNSNPEKIMGLFNKAYAKDEYAEKYNNQQKPVNPEISYYFQKEFIENVLLLYAILSVMLISNFMVTMHFYKKKTEYNC